MSRAVPSGATRGHRLRPLLHAIRRVGLASLLAVIGLIVTVGTASAADSISVTPASPSDGVTTTYTINFQEDNPINGGDSVTLAAPTGTTFSATPSDYFIYDGSQYETVAVATLSNANATVTLSVPSDITIAGGMASGIIANNVVNPPAATYGTFYSGGLYISTSGNTTPTENTTSYTISTGLVTAVPCSTPTLQSDLSSAPFTTTGGTLSLASGCTYSFSTSLGNYGNDGSPEALPAITEPVTLIGNGAILQGDWAGGSASEPATTFGFFDTSVDLVLDDVTLENSYEDGAYTDIGEGGAITIESSGVVSADSDNFLDDATAGGGGAISSASSGTGDLGAIGIYNDTFTGDGSNNFNNGGAIDTGEYGVGYGVIADSTFTNNASSRDGGAIDSGDGYGGTSTLTVMDSTFINNTADGDGGAIDNGDRNGGSSATLTVSGSTFSGNSTSGHGNGGAIANGDNSGSAVTSITNSTFSTNSTIGSGTGGAIDNGNNGGGTLTVADSTFSANTTSSDGGAIDNGDNGYANATVTSSTFVANAATIDGETIDSNDNGGYGAMTIAGDLFAGSCDQGGGPWTDLGYNADTGADCLNGGTADVASNAAVGSDLGILSSNGGSTQTILPSTGNPAIGLIPNPTSVTGPIALCPTTDQRGTSSSGGCAAGSVQPVATTSSTVLTSSLSPAISGQSVIFTATVTGSSPTGSVTFSLDGNSVDTSTLVDAVATYTPSSLAVGTHQLSASYSGDTNNTASIAAALSEVVNAAPTVPSPAPAARRTTVPPTTSPTTPDPIVQSVIQISAKQARVSGNQFVLQVKCVGSTSCSDSVVFSVAREQRVRGHLIWHHPEIAQKDLDLASGASEIADIRLTNFGAARLRKRHQLSLHTTVLILAVGQRTTDRFTIKR